MKDLVDPKIKQRVLELLDCSKNKTVYVVNDVYNPINQEWCDWVDDNMNLSDHILAALKLFVIENKIKQLPEEDSSTKLKKWDLKLGLPKKIILIREEKPKKYNTELERIKNETAWEPTKIAAIAPNLNKLKDAEMALAINDYLKYRPANPTLIPVRERALQLFGDEKALDNCRENRGLFNNQLQLASLDCFYCPEPLPFEPLALFDKGLTSNKPLLIVENANTYFSCYQANQQLQQFSAIVYGKGKRLSSDTYCDSLASIEILLSATDVYYFGDIDVEGFKIPKGIATIRAKSGQSPLKPAVDLYQTLLTKGKTTDVRLIKNKPKNMSMKEVEEEEKKLQKAIDNLKKDVATLKSWLQQWLGESLADQYLEQSTEKRWPQEGLTTKDIITALDNNMTLDA